MSRLPTINQTNDSELYMQWLKEVQHNLGGFESLAIQVQVKLKHAEIFLQNSPRPNELQTVVACECLDDLIPATGHFQAAFTAIREVLYDAIFSDTTLDHYMGRTTYFGDLEIKMKELESGSSGAAYAKERDYLIERLKKLATEDLQTVIFHLLPRIPPSDFAWIFSNDGGAPIWLRALLRPLSNVERITTLTDYIRDELSPEERRSLTQNLQSLLTIDANRQSKNASLQLKDNDTVMSLIRYLDTNRELYVDLLRDLDDEEADRALCALELLKSNQTFWKSINSLLHDARHSNCKEAIEQRRALTRNSAGTSILVTPADEENEKHEMNDASCQTDDMGSSYEKKSSIAHRRTALNSFLAKIAKKHDETHTIPLTEETISENNKGESENVDSDLRMSLCEIIQGGDRELEARKSKLFVPEKFIRPPTNDDLLGRVGALYDALLQKNEGTSLRLGVKRCSTRAHRRRSTTAKGNMAPMKVNQCESLIASIYQRKIIQDDVDLKCHRMSQPFASYVKDYFESVYGSQSAAEPHFNSFLRTVLCLQKTNPRLRMFGVIAGLIPIKDSKEYAHRNDADFLMLVLVRIFGGTENIKGQLLNIWMSSKLPKIKYDLALETVKCSFSSTESGYGSITQELATKESVNFDRLLELIMNRVCEIRPLEQLKCEKKFRQYCPKSNMNIKQWRVYMRDRISDITDVQLEDLWTSAFGNSSNIDMSIFYAYDYGLSRQMASNALR